MTKDLILIVIFLAFLGFVFYGGVIIGRGMFLVEMEKINKRYKGWDYSRTID